MADDQLPDIEQDPEVQAAEAVEADAHRVVERVRDDARNRLRLEAHLRDLEARLAAAAPSAPVPDPASEPTPTPAEPAPAPAPEPAVEAPAPEPEPPAAGPEPVQETETEPAMGSDHPSVPEEATAPEPVVDPAPESVPSEPEAAPAAPPPEPRSRRAPFPSGKTRPGLKRFDPASGAVVAVPTREWLRVRAELTDAEAADGEAGGARLQALAAAHGADAVWSPTRPAS